MRTAEKNRLQNILEDANIKLASVVSDVFGVSGRAMLQAMAQTDPNALASLAKGSLVKRKKYSLRPLLGKLQTTISSCCNSLQSIQHINDQIAQLEARMDSYTMQYREQVELLQSIFQGLQTDCHRDYC